jgi:sugar phosphate isomerase/epimerase
MNRRNFLRKAAVLSASSTIPLDSFFTKFKKMKKIGIQLFSLPRLLEKDFRGAVKMLAEMGYKEVELYGPYPFSAASARERWKAVTPALGFSGSGYFGHSAQEVRAILKEYSMTAPSIHTDLDTLQTKMDALGEAAEVLGFKYAGLPAIPEEKRQTLDDYKKMADAFNEIGEQAKRVGLKFAYHNHGYGLQEMDGQIPLNLILDRTDAGLVFFEMDIYWTAAGGADPIAYLDAYTKRYHLMHLKDMKEKVRFSGDGGDSSQWIELFPYMTTAGAGVLDVAAIIAKAEKAGVRHFFVEQDMVAEPEVALKKSADYLKAL